MTWTRALLAVGLCVGVTSTARADDCKTNPTEAERARCDLDAATKAEDAARNEWEAAKVALATATANGSPTAAAQVNVDSARKKLNELEAKTKLAEEKVAGITALATPSFDTTSCKPELVICYDRRGKLLADTLPRRVRAGDKVTLMVFTTAATVDEDKKSIAVTFQGRKSSEHLFDKNETALDSPARAPAPSDMKILSFVSDEIGDDAAEVDIRFSHVTESIGIAWTETIHVDHGRSYFSVALFVAATFKADRRVLRDLNTVSDHAVDAGFALNIFPGGRERGIIGFARRGGGFKRWVANNVGLQIGTDLDLTNPFDRLYAGVVFEPVAGLAVVGGVSLREIAVVPQAGELPALEEMDPPSDQRYVLRGYVGVTITLDLLKSISSIGSGIRGVALP